MVKSSPYAQTRQALLDQNAAIPKKKQKNPRTTFHFFSIMAAKEPPV
jgi:hypothetical protein